ncbi:MAG: hypothetical protein AB7E24_00735 [Novosphingobium sp.]
MKKATLFLTAAATLLAAPAVAAPRLTPEQQLAKAIEGRVAGKPVDCIDPHFHSNTRIIEKTAIIYGSGRTIYVNRPDNANSLRDDDVLVTELRGSGQLCSVDVVKLHDRSGLWNRGFVSLGKFVPYTRVDSAKDE